MLLNLLLNIKNMKKILLTLIALLAINQVFSQYYYIPFKNEGKNPNEINQDGENPYPLTPAGWSVIWTDDATSTPAYTANQTLPFTFKFNGSDVTQYKASNTGVLTFSTSSTSNLTAFSNVTLPNSNIPDNSVCVLGIKPQTKVSGSTTYKSTIITKTLGTAPNRQHWVQFSYFIDPNIQAGWTYWGMVFEESTNNIYIVDMKTLCVTSTSTLCGNNVKLTAGIQINSTTATSIAESPNLGAGNIATNVFNASDNSYYTFKPGVQADNDLASFKVNMADYYAITTAPYVVSGIFMNQGKTSVSNFDFAYRVNNGAPVTAKISTSIAVNGRATVNHTTPWTPSATGVYKIAIWPAMVNGSADGVAGNDTVFKTINVVPSMVERKTLNEIFTSSTCGPCTPGNVNTDTKIFPNRLGKFTVIKYQQDFPGTGDPYATTESVNRRTTPYGINSIPRMEVDGGWDGNAQNYTLALFDQFQAEPAFLKINAKHVLKVNTVTVDVKVTPLIAFNNTNLKLYIAINEKTTYNNKKSNGETEFAHVFKKFVPSASGINLGTLTQDVEKTYSTVSYTFPGSYRLPSDGQAANRINTATENSVEELSDLEVVVFIQDAVTKKVYQSDYSAGSVSGIDDIDGGKDNFAIYPNPSNGQTTLKFRLTNPHTLNISLFNAMGQEVKTLENRIFNNGLNRVEFTTEGLPKGLYFVKVQGDSFNHSENFIVD